MSLTPSFLRYQTAFGAVVAVVQSPEVELIDLVRSTFGGSDVGRPERARVTIDLDRAPWVDDVEVRVSGDESGTHLIPLADLAGFLVARLGRLNLDAEPDLAHLHASAASIHGRAVVVTGRSGAGKSVLAACLARQGSHLCDEVVTLDPANGVLLADPRPINLKVGAAPVVRPAASTPQVQRYVSPESLGLTCAPSSPPGAIVVPVRRSGPAEICEIGPVEVAEVLAANTFDLARDAKRVLEAIAWLVGSSRSFVCRYDDANEASKLILDRLEIAPVVPATGISVRESDPTIDVGRGTSGVDHSQRGGVLEVGTLSECLLYEPVSRSIARLDPHATDIWRSTGAAAMAPAEFVDQLASLGYLQRKAERAHCA